MQIAARKILFLVVPFQLFLLAGWASAQDASTSSILPEQIATAVEGGPRHRRQMPEATPSRTIF
jgi:hypothetical protein